MNVHWQTQKLIRSEKGRSLDGTLLLKAQKGGKVPDTINRSCSGIPGLPAG